MSDTLLEPKENSTEEECRCCCTGDCQVEEVYKESQPTLEQVVYNTNQGGILHEVETVDDKVFIEDEAALIEKIKKEYILAGRPDIENFEVRVEESNNTIYEKLADTGILKRSSLEFVCRDGQIVIFWCYLLTQGY